MNEYKCIIIKGRSSIEKVIKAHSSSGVAAKVKEEYDEIRISRIG